MVSLASQLGVGFFVVYHPDSKNDWGECPSIDMGMGGMGKF